MGGRQDKAQDKEPEAGLRLYKKAFESSRSGITIADARAEDMPLVYVNPAFEAVTGYPVQESLGRNCRFLHRHDRDQPGLEAVRAAIRDRRDAHVVIRNYRRDGSLFWNEFHVSPIFDEHGDLTHFIGVQHDVTDRIELEQAKDQFFRMASHDLKSPLSAVLSMAGILGGLARPGEPVAEDLPRMLGNIHRRASEMQAIIEDYLDFQAIEDGKVRLSLEPVDLAELARECEARNRDYARQKNIALAVECPAGAVCVTADPLKCMQVAQNLVGNAIKFSPARTRVRLGVRAGEGRGRFEVRDEGPGLSDADLDRLFTKYAVLGNRPTGGEKSSGLGLYISQKLAHLQHGELDAANNPDKGCTFRLTLPLAE